MVVGRGGVELYCFHRHQLQACVCMCVCVCVCVCVYGCVCVWACVKCGMCVLCVHVCMLAPQENVHGILNMQILN